MSFRDRIKNWDILGHTKLWFSISITIIVIGLIAMGFNWVKYGSPLNLGIDFRGGSVITLACNTTPDSQKVRDIVAGIGYKDAIVQEAQGNKVIIKINATSVPPDDITKIVDGVDKLYKVNKDTTQITSIAPVIGSELMRNGAIALLLALLFVLFYISIRFEFKIAVATVLALFHDILVTLGMLALFRVEINAPFIGAFLAIITYSVEDTVVVMDRIREKLKFKLRETFREIVNRSITEVWVRSMNTSITTLFASLSLVIFGGTALRDFSMTLLFGLFSGTYSSIYIASPLLVLFRGETLKEEIAKKESVVKVVEEPTGEETTEQAEVRVSSGSAQPQESKPKSKKKGKSSKKRK
ncbi:protein translocase subunit SecF [Caldisericum exile]|uniref:Protein-export membrane protein SecF n=1 Tax=Caldisericum exile (strain DSM 21853 / NBRC 104410 / AZM16c01) TaxID=511051 RepID=A0A7U6JFH4_CALEA|nr:protein translocase subunit SecF [Caldisericum exile]BAL80449.1 protein-export membrane protein SecF [Caldisericum exile AZM16c01]